MKEIIFEVLEQPMGQGFVATAVGVGVHTEADTLEDLRQNVREAVDCHFDDSMDAPKLIRLHFVRDEVLARRHGSPRRPCREGSSDRLWSAVKSRA